MAKRILQINFTFNVPAAALAPTFSAAAQPIADTPGLRWKVWLLDEKRSEAGGIYLFDDEAAANAYLAGPIVAQISSSPAFSNLSAKQFDVVEELSAITRGPVR